MSVGGVRKNFVFSQEVAEHLEELAKDSNKSMTQLLSELVEQNYQNKLIEKRKKAIDNLFGITSGLFKDETIQSIKANMDV